VANAATIAATTATAANATAMVAANATANVANNDIATLLANNDIATLTAQIKALTAQINKPPGDKGGGNRKPPKNLHAGRSIS